MNVVTGMDTRGLLPVWTVATLPHVLPIHAPLPIPTPTTPKYLIQSRISPKIRSGNETRYQLSKKDLHAEQVGNFNSPFLSIAASQKVASQVMTSVAYSLGRGYGPLGSQDTQLAADPTGAGPGPGAAFQIPTNQPSCYFSNHSSCTL